jgi:hypothetical protein
MLTNLIGARLFFARQLNESLPQGVFPKAQRRGLGDKRATIAAMQPAVTWFRCRHKSPRRSSLEKISLQLPLLGTHVGLGFL